MPEKQDAVVAFLETYGQPQQASTIQYVLRENGVEVELPDLDAMVEAGAIKKVVDGVHANGDPMEHYAPNAFSAD